MSTGAETSAKGTGSGFRAMVGWFFSALGRVWLSVRRFFGVLFEIDPRPRAAALAQEVDERQQTEARWTLRRSSI